MIGIRSIDSYNRERQREDRSRKRAELERELLQARIDQFKNRSASGGFSGGSPSSSMVDWQMLRSMTPEQQQAFAEFRRAGRESPEEALLKRGLKIDPVTGKISAIEGFANALSQFSGAKTEGDQDVRSRTEPKIQADIVSAKLDAEIEKRPRLKRAEILAERQTEAELSLPEVQATAQDLLRAINSIKDDAGLSPSVGAKNPFMGIGTLVAGTPVADFNVKLDALKAKTAMQAFQKLKGAGAITETELLQANKAVNALTTDLSEDEFLQQLSILESVVGDTESRARKASGKVVGDDIDIETSLSNAREAIANGADRNKVVNRLIKNGINPKGL